RSAFLRTVHERRSFWPAQRVSHIARHSNRDGREDRLKTRDVEQHFAHERKGNDVAVLVKEPSAHCLGEANPRVTARAAAHADDDLRAAPTGGPLNELTRAESRRPRRIAAL